jgi:hypothetical protein
MTVNTLLNESTGNYGLHLIILNLHQWNNVNHTLTRFENIWKMWCLRFTWFHFMTTYRSYIFIFVDLFISVLVIWSYWYCRLLLLSILLPLNQSPLVCTYIDHHFTRHEPWSGIFYNIFHWYFHDLYQYIWYGCVAFSRCFFFSWRNRRESTVEEWQDWGMMW